MTNQCTTLLGIKKIKSTFLTVTENSALSEDRLKEFNMNCVLLGVFLNCP